MIVPGDTDCHLRARLRLAVLLASAACGAVLAPPAFGQDAPPSATAQIRRFDIPPQPLASALTAFGDQADMQVTVDADVVAGLQSPGAVGAFAPAEALSRLLAGTGVTWRMLGPRTVRLDRAPQASEEAIQLGPVRVEGRGEATAGGTAIRPTAVLGNLPETFAGGQVARGSEVGILGNRSVFDTPFSVVPFTAQAIQDVQARKVSDVLENDPSIQAALPSSSFWDTIAIRGFQISPVEFAVNGLYGVAPSYVTTTEFVERVELFKGPNAFLNGYSPYGSVGGSVNVVTKHAPASPVTQVTASFASDSQFGLSGDIGRRFGSDEAWGVRFNAGYRDGDTATDRQSERLGVVQLGLDYHRGPLRIDADLIYQHQRMDAPLSQVYYDFGGPLPRPPHASANYQQSWEYSGSDEHIALLSGEYDLADNVTVYARAGAKRGDLVQFRDIPYDYRPNGDFISEPYLFKGYDETWTAQAGVRSQFTTGPLSHSLNVSGTTLRFSRGSLDVFGFTPSPSNLYDPPLRPRPDMPPEAAGDPVKYQSMRLNSIAVADTISLWDDRLQVVVGPRFQQVDIRSFDQATGEQRQRYNESAVTPTIALIVKPLERLGLYGSYIEGLSQGPEAPEGTSNRGEIFPPQKTDQIEIGLKYDGGDYGVTLAAFRTNQPSGRTIDTGDPLPLFIVDGEQRNQGIEFSVFGEPFRGVRLLGGIAHLDAKLRKTQDGLLDGRPAAGSPDISINIGGEWDTPFAPGLTLTGRVHHSSRQLYFDNENSIPGFTVFDLGARYSFNLESQAVTARLDVTNVANKSYWASAYNGLLLGAPRTVQLSLSANF